MGSNKNIAITPLTNRIFLTFTQALMMNLGGATHGMNNLHQFNLNSLIKFYIYKILRTMNSYKIIEFSSFYDKTDVYFYKFKLLST